MQHFVQGANVYAQFASMTVEQPYIDYTHGVTGAHSLGQIWTMAKPDPSHLSDVETGWIEDAGQFNGTIPHLFISLFDYNNFVGFVGGVGTSIPWVQSSSVAFPDMALSASNTTSHTFGTELYGGNWWIYYDGQWVGYLPPSAWTSFFPNSVTDIASGGEVATPEASTCTDMGYNGLFGSNSNAASDTTNYYLGASGMQNTAFTPYASDPSNYSTGNWIGGYSFKYGGPGWC